jgi:integrase
VFTAAQAEAWMRACCSPEYRRLKGWAILCLFCGLRPSSEAINLTWDEIDLESGEISVMGTKRGAKPRHVKLTKTALAWLKFAKEDGEATPGFFNKYQRRMAVVKANEWLAEHHLKEKPLVWDEDIQRHTYASYRSSDGVPLYALADEMGTSTRTIYAHYRNPRPAAEVKAFWAIRP